MLIYGNSHVSIVPRIDLSSILLICIGSVPTIEPNIIFFL